MRVKFKVVCVEKGKNTTRTRVTVEGSESELIR